MEKYVVIQYLAVMKNGRNAEQACVGMLRHCNGLCLVIVASLADNVKNLACNPAGNAALHSFLFIGRSHLNRTASKIDGLTCD